MINNWKTIEAAVRAAQSDDKWATEYLLKLFEPLVRKLCSAVFISGGERDDVLQYGRLGLWTAIQRYDPERHPNFSAYAFLSIKAARTTAVKTYNRRKHQHLNASISYNPGPMEGGEDCYVPEFIGEWEGNEPNPEDIIIDEISYQDTLALLKSRLSGLELSVLSAHVAGLSYDDIAEWLGITAKSVDNARERIKCKADRHLVGEDYEGLRRGRVSSSRGRARAAASARDRKANGRGLAQAA